MATIDNMLENLPEHFEKDESSNNYKFLLSFANVIEDSKTELQLLQDNLFLETASGSYLDMKGALYNIPRNGLTDQQYKDKIIFLNASKIGGGTSEAIKFALVNSLNLNEEDIEIIDDSTYACIFKINLYVDETFDSSVLTNLNSVINLAKAAGTYNKQSELLSKGGVFRVNLSKLNGTDVIV